MQDVVRTKPSLGRYVGKGVGTNAHLRHFNENCKGVGLICLKALFYQSGGFEVAAKGSTLNMTCLMW